MAKKERLGCPACGSVEFAVKGMAYVEMDAWFEDLKRGPSFKYNDRKPWMVEPDVFRIECDGCGKTYDEDLGLLEEDA